MTRSTSLASLMRATFTAPTGRQSCPGGSASRKAEIVEDGEGRREGAYEILLAEGIDAVLHADAGIGLGQHGRRNTDQSDAAVGDGGCEANGVLERASAHAYHH